MHACTIVARNYMAQARVLAESFLRHHPDGRFTVLVIDAEGRPLPTEEGFAVVGPTQVGIEERELHRMALIYDVMELATAVKPFFLRHLVETTGEPAVYFDPDIEVVAQLDDIADLAREHSIVLTPHSTEPLPHDYAEPGEVTLLLAGMFNLGFVAVGPRAIPFLEWWSERVARDCRVSPERGLFVDQRWVDFVPSLFEHHVLRDRGCNVAHWNLWSRKLGWTGDGYEVDGEPLRFFHYSGFDPRQPHLLSKFLGPEPAILLSEEPALARICADYAEKLYERGFREATRESYGYDELPNGIPIDRRMRRIYREALVEAELEGEPEPPNPFSPDGSARFVEWLNEPVGPGPLNTRYLDALHRRYPGLSEQFPDPRWRDADDFLDWLLTTGRTEAKIPLELIPPVEEVRRTADPTLVHAPGVNVAGYFRAEAGVGEAARHLVKAIQSAGIPHVTVGYDRTKSRQEHLFDASPAAAARYDVNLVCVNADQLPTFAYDVGPDFFAGRYGIGVWWWEIAEFPEYLHEALGAIDEIWVGSDFVREAIAAETTKPVLTLPFGIDVPPAAAITRADLGLPEDFLFLFSFDFDSVFARKNPAGVVEAYTRAFEPGEGTSLVLKSINGERNLAELEELRAAAEGRPDIAIVDRYLSSEEKNALTAACDCYVSLHRSEGFGLTIAEAMAHGKPVIATDYGGNRTFMTDANSYRVPFQLTEIPKGCYPYPQGALWADPDLDEARRLMRHVVENADEARAVGERAGEDVRRSLSPERTGAFVKKRLDEVRAELGPPTPLEADRASGLTAAERAERYIMEGPQIPIAAPSRVGFVGRFARRALYRVLRPYLVRNREFELAVVDALRDEAAAAQIEELRQEIQRLEQRTGDAIARHDERLERLETLRRRLRELEAAPTEHPAVEERMRILEGAVHREGSARQSPRA